MKRTKRIIAVLLAVLMLCSGAATAFAADGDRPVLPAPADNPVDTSVYVKTVLNDPKVKPASAARLVSAANTLAGLDAKLADALTGKVLTGENVILVIDSLVKMISDKLETDPKIAPLAGAIKYLFSNGMLIEGLKQDKKFDGAVEKLRKASDDGFTTIPDIAQAGVTFTSADFGFADGDAHGFVDALVCALSEILTQLDVRSILGDFTDSVKDGAYVAGNYNLFIPVYELLALNPISSVEFTEQVEKAVSEASDKQKARFRAAADLTLRPLADLLTKIETGGVDAVIDLLPRLLYALDSGMVNALVHDLLRDKNLYGFFQFNDVLDKLDLNSGLLWDVLDKNFITGTEEKPAGFDFDKDGVKETTLPLTKEQFDALAAVLAFAADPSVKPSVSATQKNRLALDTDGALVCAILLNAAVELLETEDGAAFAKAAVGSLDNDFAKRAAGAFLSLFGSQAGRFVLYRTQGLLALLAAAAARIAVLIRSLRSRPAFA